MIDKITTTGIQMVIIIIPNEIILGFPNNSNGLEMPTTKKTKTKKHSKEVR